MSDRWWDVKIILREMPINYERINNDQSVEMNLALIDSLSATARNYKIFMFGLAHNYAQDRHCNFPNLQTVIDSMSFAEQFQYNKLLNEFCEMRDLCLKRDITIPDAILNWDE